VSTLAQEIALSAPSSFSIGRIIGQSGGIFGRNLSPFLIVSLLINAPFIALVVWIDYRALQPGLAQSARDYRIALSLLQMMTSALAQASLTYGTLEDLRGRRPTIAACFSVAWRSAAPLIGATALYTVAGVLALVAFVVPAVVLYLLWWVYVPAIVVEGLGISASFARSRALTAGRRWRILGLTLATLLLLIAGLFIVELPIHLLLGRFGGEVAGTLLAEVYGAFFSVVTAVGYYTLRIEKEGVDIEAIAQVFG